MPIGDGTVDFTNTEVLQTLNYYPFGMNIEGFDGVDNIPVNQPYQYNGKEQLLGGMYDYGARLYDPMIGRWTSVDLIEGNAMQNEISLHSDICNYPAYFPGPDCCRPSYIRLEKKSISE